MLLHRDITRFEIHIESLAIAGITMLVLTLVLSGLRELMASLAIALTLGLTTEAIRRLKPSRMGAGDPWGFAALGCAGSAAHIIPVVMLTGVVSIMTAAAYSVARGKRCLHSMFPAAIALVPAMLMGVLLQLLDAVGVTILLSDIWHLSLSFELSITLLVIGGVVTVGYWISHRIVGELVPRHSQSKENINVSLSCTDSD
ncbi:MAG: hypothetical protein OXC62_15490 [Aestuariivita sp.]|nr:hypothetical protein [Aestuariivita sp.]